MNHKKSMAIEQLWRTAIKDIDLYIFCRQIE